MQGLKRELRSEKMEVGDENHIQGNIGGEQTGKN